MILLSYLCGSARVWMLSFKSQGTVNHTSSQDNVEIIPKLTLFGHSARIWDCYVSDSVSLLYSVPSPFVYASLLHLLLVFLVWRDITKRLFPSINRISVKFPVHLFFG